MSTRRDKDRLDAWITREQDDEAPERCMHCGAPIWPQPNEEGIPLWVDSSDGDGCWEGLTRHEPNMEIEVDMPDPCDYCEQIGVHDPECSARPFPFLVTVTRHRWNGGLNVAHRNGDLVLSTLTDNDVCAQAMRNLVLYAQTADSLGRMADTLSTLARRLAYQEGIQSTHTTEENGK